MTQHYMDVLWLKLGSRVYYSVQHGLTGNKVQDFRDVGFHATALAGSENNDMWSHGRLPVMPMDGDRHLGSCRNEFSIPREKNRR